MGVDEGVEQASGLRAVQHPLEDTAEDASIHRATGVSTADPTAQTEARSLPGSCSAYPVSRQAGAVQATAHGSPDLSPAEGRAGLHGGESTLREAVRQLKEQKAEVFVPLSHPPGEAQVDFGHAQVIVAGERVSASYLVMTVPYSDALFCSVFPKECTETFQEGHVRAFEFFGGVLTRISYDNSRIAISKIEKQRGKTWTSEFHRLVSHHLYEPHFCRVRRANEKGVVEETVGFSRRNFLVPVPQAASWEELNRVVADR